MSSPILFSIFWFWDSLFGRHGSLDFGRRFLWFWASISLFGCVDLCGFSGTFDLCGFSGTFLVCWFVWILWVIMEQQKMNQGSGEKMNHFVGERKNNKKSLAAATVTFKYESLR
jgi:hypothetical protein